MRHQKKFNHLSRTRAHRRAMLANMASSLIMHKRIHTTLAKAKALRVYVEPLITRSKEDTTHSRRVVFSYLQNKEAVTELFREISQKVFDRPGGYTRILKTGNRLGDNAEMCMIELVDYNQNLLKESKDDKAKTSRRKRRGGGKKKIEEAPVAETAVKEVEDTEVAGPEAEVAEETEAIAETPAEVITEEPKEEVKVKAEAEVKEEIKEGAKEEKPKAETKEKEPEKGKEENPEDKKED